MRTPISVVRRETLSATSVSRSRLLRLIRSGTRVRFAFGRLPHHRGNVAALRTSPPMTGGRADGETVRRRSYETSSAQPRSDSLPQLVCLFDGRHVGGYQGGSDLPFFMLFVRPSPREWACRRPCRVGEPEFRFRSAESAVRLAAATGHAAAQSLGTWTLDIRAYETHFIVTFTTSQSSWSFFRAIALPLTASAPSIRSS